MFVIDPIDFTILRAADLSVVRGALEFSQNPGSGLE
jgi:hypothetical protein